LSSLPPAAAEVDFLELVDTSVFLLVAGPSSLLEAPPLGLRLESRFFLDLDSDLDVPLITFVIFWTVLSVIDSVRESLGDLVLETVRPVSCPWTPDPVLTLVSVSSLSPLRKDPDFLSLFPVAVCGEEGEGVWAGSLARAPSWEGLAVLFPVGGVFAVREAVEAEVVLPERVAIILLVRLCWGGAASSCSGPSSGMVG